MNDQEMLKENSLKDKVIVVTGGGSGLGLSMTSYFLKLGATVLITGRNESRLKEAAGKLSSIAEGQVTYLAGDVREVSDVEKSLAYAIDKFGKVNGLVNNAAGNFISPTERLSTRAFDVIIDIVLKGTINNTLTFGKYWIENSIKATVLNIITTYSWTGSGFVVPSACAKAGVLALTRSLAVEWAKYNIRTNAIAPGPFPTEGAWSRLLPGDLKEKFDVTKKVPLKRVGEHQELANLAAYLISDFSGFINGEVVTIDGGEWLQGAGEFNMLEAIPKELWDQLDAYRKMKKG